MNILVPVKRVVDPYVSIQIDQAAQCVKTDNVKMAMNPFDEIALEEAIRIKEKSETPVQVIVVTIGTKACQEILRHGLALGADEAIHIETEKPLQPLSIAKVLKHIVNDRHINLVLMGKQAIDGDNNQTGQMLAALLDWPQACFASELIIRGNELEVTREIDGGLETIGCQLPAIVTADLRLNEPRYASLPNIMKSKSKPLQDIVLDDMGLTLNEDLEQLAAVEPPVRQAGIIVPDAATLVEQLKQKEHVFE